MGETLYRDVEVRCMSCGAEMVLERVDQEIIDILQRDNPDATLAEIIAVLEEGEINNAICPDCIRAQQRRLN